MRLVELRDRDDVDPLHWHYEARIGDGPSTLAIQCKVEVRLAYAYDVAEWWAERGNFAVARSEARKWAEAQVRRQAEQAFAAAMRKAVR